MTRILIIGDSCMGKSTLAKKLGEKLHIPLYSSDDFFYIKKYTHKRDMKDAVKLVKQSVQKQSWVLEGSTRRIMTHGIAKADVILYLKSTSLLRQYYLLFTREDSQQDLWNMVSLAKYLFMKHFKLGDAKKVSYEKLLLPHMKKVTILHNFSEINEWYLTTIKNSN